MKAKLSLPIIVALLCAMGCTATVNAYGEYSNGPVRENINAYTYITKGSDFYESGNYKEAIKCYDMAIAIATEAETAETGWAGKELAFYKQGNYYDALCCYYKLIDIDRSTNLIEKRKKELVNFASEPTKISAQQVPPVVAGVAGSVVGAELAPFVVAAVIVYSGYKIIEFYQNGGHQICIPIFGICYQNETTYA